MTFDDFERSVQGSRPIELYTMSAGANLYFITTYHKDISYSARTFTATPGARSNLESFEVASDQFDVSIELPSSHPLVQQYANGVPPDQATCVIERMQPDYSTSIALKVWQGNITAMSFKGRMGSFRVPAATVEAMQQTIPNMVAQNLCNHTLYDKYCTKLANSYRVDTTISAVSTDGKTITTNDVVPADVAQLAPNDAFVSVPWSLHGIFVHTPSGNRRTIISQPGTGRNQFVIQCEFPSASLVIGQAVTIYAGCARTRSQCRAKFANVINFGGMPDIPRSNVFYSKNIFSSAHFGFSLGDN